MVAELSGCLDGYIFLYKTIKGIGEDVFCPRCGRLVGSSPPLKAIHLDAPLCANCLREKNRLKMKRSYGRNPQYFRDYQKANYNPWKSRVWARTHQLFPRAKTCQVNGCQEIGHRHHNDYNKYYDIIWLCPLHHTRLHLQTKK